VSADIYQRDQSKNTKPRAAKFSVYSLRSLRLCGLIFLLAACTPNSAAPQATILPFPTVTPGQELYGVLPVPEGLLLDGSLLLNPATAVALANQPTPTPNTTICPPISESTRLADLPTDTDAINAEIERFLTAGGDPLILDETLADEWDILGANGYVRADLDLTGEGQADVLLGYTVPVTENSLTSTPTPTAENEASSTITPLIQPTRQGILLILGCADGRYHTLYRARSDEGAPPELLLLGDVNRDQRSDVLFTSRNCDASPCVYQTNVVTWEARIGRFASLLGTVILSDTLPTITDIDSDEISEIVIRRDDEGTEETGPIRTGVNIYDWNGTVYVLSIVQPDPPGYLIQVIHEADRFFSRREMLNAIQLYQVALTDTTLRPWLQDETPSLRSYALFRELIAQAFSGDPALLTTYQQIAQNFPGVEPSTVYVEMSRAFWDNFQTNANLTTACSAALAVVSTRPEAVELLNLYGSRSPRYEPADLCPF